MVYAFVFMHHIGTIAHIGKHIGIYVNPYVPMCLCGAWTRKFA